MHKISRILLSILLLVFLSFAADVLAERSVATPVNNPPVATPDAITVHGSTITPPNANALSNDYDPDNHQLLVNHQQQTSTPLGLGSVGQYGAISAVGGGTPGTFVIPYSITDNHGGQASSNVTVTVVNSAPSAATDYYEVAGNLLDAKYCPSE